MTPTGPSDPGRRWEDEAALRSLSEEYAAAADDRDGARFAELFVPDGTLVVPKYPDDLRPVKSVTGRDALRLVPEALRRYERTFHQVTNTRFTVEGDEASGHVQCTAHHLSGSGPAGRGSRDHGSTGDGSTRDGPTWIDHVWFIRYRDEYVRTPRGWRFVRRVLELQWVEDHAVAQAGPSPSGPSDWAGGAQPTGTGAGGGVPT